MEAEKCVLCKADFRPNALVTSVGGVKKCKPCEAKWPEARTNEEIQVKNKNKTQTLDEARVVELIYEKLEEANIKRIECEACGKQFFRRGPMQKLCPVCKTLADVKKEGK